MSLLPVAEALARILALVPRMPVETVPLGEGYGRVLAEDAVAGRPQPPFPASAMDGYAVRAAEAVLGARLRVEGEAVAGRAHVGPLASGAACRIFTGAQVPEGADAILIQENALREGDAITVEEAPEPAAWIRPAGTDFPAGHRLAAPRRLTARDLGLLAAMNRPVIRAARRPRVALIPTGDELVEPGTAPGPGQIVSSSTPALAARLALAGAEPLPRPIARDRREALSAAIEGAIADGADMLVTLGGASVGEHDLVAGVLTALGAELDFHRVAMRPGKPLMAGRLGAAAVIGLPGNPVSAMICTEIFVVPAIEAALGLPAGPRPRIRARLAAALPANGVREHYARARLEPQAEGLPLAHVFDRQDSSLVATLAAADAVVVMAPNAPARPAGAEVDAIPLP